MSAWRAAQAMPTAEAACRATPDPACGAALEAAPARVAGLRSAAANWFIEVGHRAANARRASFALRAATRHRFAEKSPKAEWRAAYRSGGCRGSRFFRRKVPFLPPARP